jgi:hypothetical protein
LVSGKLYSYYEENINSLSKQNLQKLQYIKKRQDNDLLPIIAEIGKKYGVLQLYTEFLTYFCFKDIILLIQNETMKRNRYENCMKILSDKKMLEEFEAGRLKQVKTLSKTENIYKNIFLVFPKNKMGYLVMYIMISFIISVLFVLRD